MGLFQNLLETYEKCSEVVGLVPTDAEGNADEKKTLLPIFHMTFKSAVCVKIDSLGNFIDATRDAKETTIIIPCTEESAGRSNDKADPKPHPLCDQLDYIGGIKDAESKNYLAQLATWKDGLPALEAIYKYVSGKTIIGDLIDNDIFKDNEFQNPVTNILDHEKIRKIGVRFAVQLDGRTCNVWEEKELRKTWINQINSTTESDSATLDYLSGENTCSIATQHPKNINSQTGNAKLLSCNDTSGFTFRGRFAKQDDAVIVDYAQSQKMHQILRWLIANYGYAVDSQVIVTWAVDSNPAVEAKSQDNSYQLFGEMASTATTADILSEASTKIYADYSVKLRNLLQGYGNASGIKKHSRKICLAAFDAATTGRMGLVFYQELPENTYLESIVDWHSDTSYYLTAWKKEKDDKGKEKNTPVRYIGAPSYDDILFAVYGKSRGDKSYDTLKKKTRKQLLECMFGNFAFPKSMVEMAANRASHPMSFIDSNGKFSINDWCRSLNITCALARKYYKQQKEKIQLELEINRTDRDYLFGRLLSIADKMENYALYKSGIDRPTNAIKLMSAFQIKPHSTWGQLYNQLIPYKNQLNGAAYYQSLIDKVMVMFQSGDYEDNSPLSPLYLLGYSAQNIALSKNNKNENSKENDNGDTTAE